MLHIHVKKLFEANIPSLTNDHNKDVCGFVMYTISVIWIILLLCPSFLKLTARNCSAFYHQVQVYVLLDRNVKKTDVTRHDCFFFCFFFND